MKFAVPEDVLVQELDGEMVLLNLENEQYYGLDDVGTSMWSAIAEFSSIEAALQSLQAKYEVEPNQLCQDLQELTQQLVAHGLLRIVQD